SHHPAASTLTVLSRKGGRLDWSPDSRAIAVDRIGNDGCADVFVMSSADGSAERCITCDHQRLGLPPGHKGNPAWHPSGDWIVIQVAQGPARCDFPTSPSRGRSNELWAVRPDASSAVRLVEVDPARPDGCLEPHFDPKGERIVWSQMTDAPSAGDPRLPFGGWKLRIAAFSVRDGRPALEHPQDLPLTTSTAVLAQGFTPDGAAILWAANPDPSQAFTGLDLGFLDLEKRVVTRRITSTPTDLERHARVTPAGRVVFTSTRGLPGDLRHPSAEYWVAEPDGAMWRLTSFNNAAWELRPPNFPLRVAASDAEFSPDGSSLASHVAFDDAKGEGAILRIQFSSPL
ncbi:MAG TPA: hypothetical protein PLI95_26845, partial [Polyangiaceae bacterium]|nr:hypothetical protein [Polyangiaceae bacterium]